jgi:hypothetical protein
MLIEVKNQEEVVWLPLSAIAREYQKSAKQIRLWARDGLLIEIGFMVRRDPTGHWIIGVPSSAYRTFRTQPVVNPTQSM